jgi:hypothetical protein
MDGCPILELDIAYKFNPRMNLRTDIGFGTNSTGFYFDSNEAY